MPPRSQPIDLSATVKLDGSGNGRVQLAAPSGTRWDLDLASVSTTSTVSFARCFLYRNVSLIDSTYNGNAASSAKVAGIPWYHGTPVVAVFSGGDPNAYATLEVFGTQVTGYRS